MAKLSARGAYKIAEFRKIRQNDDGSLSEYRKALRSDNVILESSRSQWESLGSRMDRDKNPESPVVYEWLDWSGWRIRGKLKATVTPDDWQALHVNHGWTAHK